MEITVKSKFEVGDTLKVKGSDTRLVVDQVVFDVCSAGPQVHYAGIALIPSNKYVLKEEQKEYLAIPDKRVQLNESLLEKV